MLRISEERLLRQMQHRHQGIVDSRFICKYGPHKSRYDHPGQKVREGKYGLRHFFISVHPQLAEQDGKYNRHGEAPDQLAKTNNDGIFKRVPEFRL